MGFAGIFLRGAGGQNLGEGGGGKDPKNNPDLSKDTQTQTSIHKLCHGGRESAPSAPM